MTLLSRLHELFDIHPVPAVAREGAICFDGDWDDVLSFKGMAWPDVSMRHWQAHFSAYAAFPPDTFRYYLPSIIKNATISDRSEFIPVSSLLGSLDTSAVPELWDDFFVERFTRFNAEQYRLMFDWVSSIGREDGLIDDVSRDRILSTILTLEEQARKARASRTVQS